MKRAGVAALVAGSLGFVCFASCRGPSVRSLPSEVESQPVERSDAEALPAAPRAPRSRALGFGPPFDGDEGDVVVARQGDFALHKRHIYDRLLEIDPRTLAEIEESLLLDAKVRRVARTLGVSVQEGELDFEVAREWARIERAYGKDARGLPSLDAYVSRLYGMDEAGFRAHVRRLAWRRKMRAYTIRYAQRMRGTILLQRFVAASRAQAERARRAIFAGGDFAQVATRSSRGTRARQGGRLPRLILGMEHPALALAEGVEVGGLSEIRASEESFAFVRVVERTAPRALPFEACQIELRRELERRPIAREELVVFHAAFDEEASATPASAAK